MRVALYDNQVPFVVGGAERLREQLLAELRRAGCEAELFAVPYRWVPTAQLVRSMAICHLLDPQEAGSLLGTPFDRAIALRFPAYLLRHSNKVVWLTCQHRTANDLWNTPFCDLQTFEHPERIRDLIRQQDRDCLPLARRIFAVSRTVAGRLLDSCGIAAEVLYPPVPGGERLHRERIGDSIVYAARLDALKRPRLLVEAMAHTHSPVRCQIAGRGLEEGPLRRRLVELGLETRVEILGYVSDERIADLYANALAVFYGPYQEDFGYGTLEAFLSGKPVVTTTDSGGPLEFVVDGRNGFVVPPEPEAIATALDRLYENRELAGSLGDAGRRTVDGLGLSWEHVLARLLA